MTDNKKSGIALIAGSLGGILVMATHPTAAHATLTPQLVEHLALGSAIVHALAMAATLALLLGAIGLTRQLASSENSINPDRLAFTGLIVFAFSVVAILQATSVSGFIVPNIWKKMFQDTAANASQWQIVLTAVFQFNQTFAAIYSVAASVAIVLWSVSGLRHGSLSRGIAICGCILPPIVIVLIAVGHVRLDVHGMGAVVPVHAVWFVTVGIRLCRREPQTASPQ
jgi:hypothetical protein